MRALLYQKTSGPCGHQDAATAITCRSPTDQGVCTHYNPPHIPECVILDLPLVPGKEKKTWFLRRPSPLGSGLTGCSPSAEDVHPGAWVHGASTIRVSQAGA